MSATDIFGAISNPVRRRILELLREGPRTSGEIASEFDQSRAAVSEHLGVLRNVGLVTSEAKGRQRVYHLVVSPLNDVTDWLRPFERYWQQRLSALESTLSEENDDRVR